MQSGVAIYLAHDYHGDTTLYRTGAIPGVVPPQHNQKVSWGEWHTVDIELTGERLKASIDSSLVQNIDLAAHQELRYRLKRGYIGFPDQGYAYSLRNIRIEDLGVGAQVRRTLRRADTDRLETARRRRLVSAGR